MVFLIAWAKTDKAFTSSFAPSLRSSSDPLDFKWILTKTNSNLLYRRNIVIYGDRVKYVLNDNDDACFNSIPIDSSYRNPRYSDPFCVQTKIRKKKKVNIRHLLETFDLQYHWLYNSIFLDDDSANLWLME